MKLLSLVLLSLYLPFCFAETLTIKEDENPHFSLWRCEGLDKAVSVFKPIFSEKIKERSIENVFITSFFINHGNAGSWFTTVRLTKDKETLFFSVDRHYMKFSSGTNKLTESDNQLGWSTCFNQCFNTWQSYKQAKGFATPSDVITAIVYQPTKYRFNEKLAWLILIKQLSNNVPRDYFNDYNIVMTMSAHSGEEYLKRHSHERVHATQSSNNKVTADAHVSFMAIPNDMNKRMENYKGHSEYSEQEAGSYNGKLEATIFATNRLYKHFLKRFK